MKRGLNIFFLFSIFLILGLSFVSAGLISNLWVRTTGNVVMINCTSSCASLGYQCGTANICGQLVNCGTCLNGYNCLSGKCIPSNSTCVDSDNGLNYLQKGSLNFTSSPTFIIKEGEIMNVSGTYFSIAFIDYTSVRFNIGGLIITSAISEGGSYYDGMYSLIVNKINYSDKIYGINSVEFTFPTKSITGVVDFCINSDVLDEFYCEGNLTAKNITYNCGKEGKVCLNGACVLPPKCTDSDGGLNYYTKGIVTYTYNGLSTILNDKSIAIDYCSNNYLNEAYCFLDTKGMSQFGWKGLTCKYGCSNGECKKFFGIFR